MSRAGRRTESESNPISETFAGMLTFNVLQFIIYNLQTDIILLQTAYIFCQTAGKDMIYFPTYEQQTPAPKIHLARKLILVIIQSCVIVLCS